MVLLNGVFFPGAYSGLVAKTPDEAAEMIINFIDKFDMKSTGEFYAPGGAK